MECLHHIVLKNPCFIELKINGPKVNNARKYNTPKANIKVATARTNIMPQFLKILTLRASLDAISLGSEYAGLFSNNDKLSKQLIDAGENVEEKLWRMPLNENFDKLINSKNADMQNINYVGGAGSTTAAQFLQRFIINKTPWAHLDIAGMAFSKYGGALNSGGATGYGVRLLNRLVEDYYE